MTHAVCKLTVKKEDSNGSFRRYAIFTKNEHPCFDITGELEALEQQDKEDGYAPETGPRFGFGIHNALIAIEAHEAWQAATPSSVLDKIKVPFRGSWRTYPKGNSTVVKRWSW